MYRVLTFLFVTSLFLFTACSKQESPAQSTSTNVPASASVAPSVDVSIAPSTAPSLATSVAPSPTTATGSVSPTVVPTVVIPPAPQISTNGKQAKTEQKPLPPDLWQRMTRPLTLEEINKLPPEIRDTILRAQGRMPASPSPSPKKKY